MAPRPVRRLGGGRRRPPRLFGPLRRDRSIRPHPRRADTDGGVHAVKITVPELSLVLLIGPSGSGKSTFAAGHFLPTEVLSSDFCRGLVSDNENDQAATNDAFEVLQSTAAKRSAVGRLPGVAPTNVQPEARKPLVALAREYDVLPTAIVFNLPERLCHDRNRGRLDRDFGAHVIRRQSEQLRRSLKYLSKEGFRHVAVLRSPEDVEAAVVERQPTWTNRRTEHGPFDIIGDVHGCFAELVELLRERFQGRASRRVRDFALFGETTGETDEFGLRVRYDWAQEYRGHAVVVYGHTPVPEAVWVNGTINIDTGCVFGGRLTALRYPERELVSVPAGETYYEPLKPLAVAEPDGAPDRDGGVLDLQDVLGTRIVA